MSYKDYIKVEQEFIPVFSLSQDRIHPESWKSFYPHKSFKEILALTIETLEKGSTAKDKPIWISGTYGTGKTFASFVLKHILEDELSEVEKYFSHHEMPSLWQRIAGIRNKGNILVVHQNSSSGINSQNKLFNTIIDSVKRTLREKGYRHIGAESIYEKVLSTLKDPDSPFNFKGVFQKYRGKFLEYSSVEEIVDNLEKLEDEERLNLLEDIVEVAERESYNWSMSVYDVIGWLKDVREKNNLYAVFFIWDEFTEYFRNNPNNLTGLQEIAENAEELSFYFFLITHSDARQLVTDDNQRKIVEARFKIASLSLAESTAFQLMAQALTIDSDNKKQWQNTILPELWEKVKNVVDFIIKQDPSICLDDMKKLLPIHPYAAYLLKFISQALSSNQRTMFQFLCDDAKYNFKSFIENHEFKFNGDNYLTADFLWDYFFQEDNADIDKDFLDAMVYYQNFSSHCKTENQRRIFKVMLILYALQQKHHKNAEGATKLLQATLKNICTCFSGTPFSSEVQATLNNFVKKGIISALEDSEDTRYITASTQINPEKLEGIVKILEVEQSFDNIIKDSVYETAKNFKPTDYLQYRLDIQVISPIKFLQAGNFNFKTADNQILTFFILVKDEEEQGKVNQTVQKIRERFSERCIIADFSSTPLTRQRYEKFIQNKAREKYFQSLINQPERVKIFRNAAQDIIGEWNRQLDIASVRVWSNSEEPAQVKGFANFFGLIRELNKKIFGSGLEEISINDKIFSSSGLTDNVAKLAFGGDPVKGASSWLNTIGDSFRELSRYGGEEYWLNNPSHPISKMKIIVEKVIAEDFEMFKAFSITDIWKELQKTPVGLVKCPGAIFLLTILLKDYADKNFYVRDSNFNTNSLTGDRLCNLIANTVKDSPQARDKFIVQQTLAHKRFCLITAEIFNIPKEKNNSLEDAAKNLKIRLTQMHYPLWILKNFVEEKYSASPEKNIYMRFLNLLEEYLNPQNGRGMPKIADEVYSIYEQNPLVFNNLQIIIRAENFKSGMNIYVSRYKPELKEIVGRLKLSDAEYLSQLNNKLSADSAYLWTVEDVNRQIDNLCEELHLVESMNFILSEPKKKLSDALRAFGDKLNKIRIPRAIVEESFPDLKSIFQIFTSLRNNTEKNFVHATEEFKDSAQLFKNFFENQFEIFAKSVKKYVDISVDLILAEKLFSEVSTGIFFNTLDEFALQIKNRLKKFRQDEKTTKFLSAWREVTGSNSPADWSDKKEIPILCIFQDCLEEAQSYFSALNQKSSALDERALDEGLKFIHGKKISRLKNKKTYEKSFVTYFCGENYSVVVDADNLRKILRKFAGNNVYSWFSQKKNCEGKIKAFAERNYQKNFLPIVREKIRELTAEEAQEYLEQLIDKDTLLGIRVLKDT